jgi:RNA polymerase sigma factor for flagellar operon FliA
VFLLQAHRDSESTTSVTALLEEPNKSLVIMTERALYERYQRLVRRVARRVTRQLPAHVAGDELVAAGFIGLVEGLRKRGQIDNDEQFESYLVKRIKGAILDHLRSLDPLSRSQRRTSRHISRAIDAMTRRLGRPPTEDEMAEKLGVSADDYRVMLSEIARSEPARIELTESCFPPSTLEQAPDLLASRRQMAARVSAVTDRLAPRLQLVLRLYYIQDLSFREIGELLGVTEARICQLHAEAIRLVRVELGVSLNRGASGETEPSPGSAPRLRQA